MTKRRRLSVGYGKEMVRGRYKGNRSGPLTKRNGQRPLAKGNVYDVGYGKEVSADEVVTEYRSQKEVGSDNRYGPARLVTQVAW